MRALPILLSLALILPGSALARLEPSQGGRAAYAQFKRLDHDGDGGLSLAELRRGKGGDALFRMLDADGDGRLSLKEVEGAGGGLRVARFDVYDADRNGFVSRQEFPKALDVRLVAALDRDHDGRLSLREIRPAFAGTHISKPVHATQRASRPAQARTDTYCWIPAIGDDGWWIEAPVTSSGCRLR